MKITTLCDPLCSLWFNLPYHTQILRKGEKVHALANYQRADYIHTLNTARLKLWAKTQCLTHLLRLDRSLFDHFPRIHNLDHIQFCDHDICPDHSR